jgi:ankyrin repeat protein
MRTAASYARWELVLGLLDAGVTVPVGGTTPLHVAAGAGELGVVQRLIEHGADVTAQDPTFHAVPLVWANFLHQAEVAAWLEAQESPER